MIEYFKRLIRSYFGFSGNQTAGFLILVPFMIVLVFSAPVYRHFGSFSKPDYSADVAFLDSLVFVNHEVPEETTSISEIVIAKFNPNELNQEGFLRMGFPLLVAKRIVNYRDKGGTFRIKSDLAKIYGLESELYKKVEPYIALPDSIQKPVFEMHPKEVHTKREIRPFDLNMADTTQLKQITGIGKVLSERIVKYRNQLGGFVAYQQLHEVYHLDSITITRLLEHAFIEENFQPVRININLATEAELSKHPYISYSAAKAIVTYRFQHGKFKTLDDLKKVVALTDEHRENINPYVIIE